MKLQHILFISAMSCSVLQAASPNKEADDKLLTASTTLPDRQLFDCYSFKTEDVQTALEAAHKEQSDWLKTIQMPLEVGTYTLMMEGSTSSIKEVHYLRTVSFTTNRENVPVLRFTYAAGDIIDTRNKESVYTDPRPGSEFSLEAMLPKSFKTIDMGKWTQLAVFSNNNQKSAHYREFFMLRNKNVAEKPSATSTEVTEAIG